MKFTTKHIWLIIPIALQLTILTISIDIIYNLYFKEIIWKKKFINRVSDLSENLDKNHESFTRLIDFSNNVEPIPKISFSYNSIVTLNVSHLGNVNSDFTLYFSNSNQISYSGEPISKIEKNIFDMSDSEIFETVSKDSMSEINWSYDFKGNKKEKDFVILLKYLGWSMEQITYLETLLHDTNSMSFEKSKDGAIIITYYSNDIESWDYIILHNNVIDTNILDRYVHWKKLHYYDNPKIYWAYYYNTIISVV